MPTSPELALLQAQASLLAALRAAGRATRLRVDLLPPGLNRAIEQSHALSEPLLGFTALALAEALRGLRVRVVFGSAGAAAGASAAFRAAAGRPVGAHVSLGAIEAAVTRDAVAAGRDFTAAAVSAADPCDVYLLAAPANARGDAVVLAVEAAVAKAPAAAWVLLNPELEDTALSHAFGIQAADAARRFVGGFETAYHYRGVFEMQRPANRPLERGCVLRHHGGPWVAHGLCEEAGGFEELARFEHKPSRAELSSLPW